MKKLVSSLVFVFAFAFCALALAHDEKDTQYLQDISVMVTTSGGSGSGVVVTREMKVKPDSDEKVRINFVWTAAHVIRGMRSVRDFIDPVSGQSKKVIEYQPVYIVKHLVENGRKVGEVKMETRVVKYSDADTGHDLALLRVLKTNFIDTSAKFYLSKDIPSVGTPLYHVGSLLGSDGANSLTNGIISQIGRVLQLSNGNTKVFDQTTTTAFPGSSGGGVFLGEGENKNKYMGMLVRGAGETFNLVVPVRRLVDWSKEVKMEWAVDESVETPTLQDVEKIPVE